MARVVACALTVLAIAGAVGGAAAAPETADLAFYPQAGILWRDLYVNNFVDLDPGLGVRDFACGTQTYDGRTGEDSDIRSFREMDLGVPVFAALDGRVISIQDGNSDRKPRLANAAFRQPRRAPARHGALRGLRPSAARGSSSRGGGSCAPDSRSAGPPRVGTRPGRTFTSRRRSTAR